MLALRKPLQSLLKKKRKVRLDSKIKMKREGEKEGEKGYLLVNSTATGDIIKVFEAEESISTPNLFSVIIILRKKNCKNNNK